MFLPLDKDYPVMLASQVKLPPTQQPNQKNPSANHPNNPPQQNLARFPKPGQRPRRTPTGIPDHLQVRKRRHRARKLQPPETKLHGHRRAQHVDVTLSNPSEVIIQGKAIKSFNTEQLLVYLATHGAKHQWERMEWLVDIARVIGPK